MGTACERIRQNIIFIHVDNLLVTVIVNFQAY
jgi:hypothetical protein